MSSATRRVDENTIMKVLRKMFDHRNNLKELLNVTGLGNAYIANIVEMGRLGQWVKAL